MSRDNGNYFKETDRGITQLTRQEYNNLPQAAKDVLNNTTIENPLVWMINPKDIDDVNYAKNYQTMLNNARLAIFGKIPGSVIITAWGRDLDYKDFRGSNGKFVAANFARAVSNYLIIKSLLREPEYAVVPVTGTPVAIPELMAQGIVEIKPETDKAALEPLKPATEVPETIVNEIKEDLKPVIPHDNEIFNNEKSKLQIINDANYKKIDWDLHENRDNHIAAVSWILIQANISGCRSRALN